MLHLVGHFPYRFCSSSSSVFFRNLSDVLDAGLSQYPYKYYTLQHYPTHICNGPNAKNTNITYFVSHANGES